jgi:CRP/FNR family transcriptional regulator, cyclic AMP receptor protein
MTVLEALQRAPLFKDFGAAGLETFAAFARTAAVADATPLFVEGETGDALYVVMAGSVRITQRSPDGEREVGRLGPGDHLGDLGLLARSPHLVSAVAAGPCEVVELRRREFFKMAQERPVTCLKLATVIAAELARRIEENKDALRQLAWRRAR